MPNYKLTYYNGRGLGEMIRLTFVEADVGYEDNRVTKAEWEKLKPTVPVKTMPFLEVDGKIIGQSLAIARYVAREHGLMPSGNFQQALVEQIIDTVTDFRLEIFKAVFESNASRKEEMMKKVNNETIPKYLGILEEILKSNMGGEKFFIGESVTLADICVFDGLNIPLEKKLISLEKHPLLDDHYTRIESLPKIAEWLEKRPKSEY